MLQTDTYGLEELVNDYESAYESSNAFVQDSINTKLIPKFKC